jgi:hypothetical protein
MRVVSEKTGFVFVNASFRWKENNNDVELVDELTSSSSRKEWKKRMLSPTSSCLLLTYESGEAYFFFLSTAYALFCLRRKRNEKY